MSDISPQRREIANTCGQRDYPIVPFDTGIMHGPHDLPATQLLEIMRRSNVARCFRPAGSMLAPAIGLPVHGPVRRPAKPRRLSADYLPAWAGF